MFTTPQFSAVIRKLGPLATGNYLAPVGSFSLSVGPIARSKHSSTQVKRLFKKNPARRRIQLRNEKLASLAIADAADAKSPTPSSVLSDKNYPQLSQPTYLPIFKPTFLKNGWSAPPPPEVDVPEYPFRVTRTGRKPFGAAGFLPVYSDIRVHGTKQTTIIRNVKGDISAFLDELQAVLELPVKKYPTSSHLSSSYDISRSNISPKSKKHGGGEAGRGVSNERPIRIRAGGTIEVNGDRARDVREWLAGLGF